jgi:starch-binding outer membrane protein, SusD/RagB family
MKTNKIFIAVTCLSIAFTGCTKLDEKLNASVSGQGSSSNAASLLKATYDALRGPIQSQDRFWALQEHTTDEVVGPTRGGDWDDNGIWRVLHNHNWDADHAFIRDTYNDFGKVIFNATDLLRPGFSATAQQQAEARFLRAYANFCWLDGWNQCPYREPGSDPLLDPKVRVGNEALDYIIAELNAVINDLPAGPSGRANKNAARVLLMKCYLNKGVIANRATPTFAAADMNQVIALADQIISSGSYSINSNFFDNFAKNNDVISSELIYASQNIGGSESGNIRSRWFCTMHYNQNPSGWNGFTTLSDFYDKFDAADPRRGGTYPGVTNVSGLRTGFLVGQQVNQSGTPLNDRRGAPLSFTRAVALKETGNNLEVTGIRVIKYPPDYTSGDNVDNDAVIFRYADVLMMKAEAILRGGTPSAVAPTTPLALVNAVRTPRGIAALGSVTLDVLYDERGREFYWEGMRRQDMIRFGKFLLPKQLKPGTSDSKYLLFPIPNEQLAANPNLKQNPGY